MTKETKPAAPASSGAGTQEPTELLDYERINSERLTAAILLRDGERLLVLQPFGWRIDGSHIPNAAEQFSRDGVCAEHGWEVVCEYGPYIAVVKGRGSK